MSWPPSGTQKGCIPALPRYVSGIIQKTLEKNPINDLIRLKEIGIRLLPQNTTTHFNRVSNKTQHHKSFTSKYIHCPKLDFFFVVIKMREKNGTPATRQNKAGERSTLPFIKTSLYTLC